MRTLSTFKCQFVFLFVTLSAFLSNTTQVNGLSQQWQNTEQRSLSPSPSLPSSRGSTDSSVINAVHQAEDCDQTCKQNKYMNFDYSVIIHPPPPSPVSYTLSDFSVSSEDGSDGEENPAAVTKSVRCKLVAERKHQWELADREEREDRRQRRQLRIQMLKEKYEKWEEKQRAAREEQERIEQELTERATALWEAEKLWLAKEEERQSQRQETKARKEEKKERAEEKKQRGQSAWVEEEEDETCSTDCAERPTEPKRRKKTEIFWKGFGKNEKKKEKEKEQHQLEDEQVRLPVLASLWKGFGKNKKKKEKNQQQDQLDELEAGPSVRTEEERCESLAIGNAEVIPKSEKCRKRQTFLWKGFGKNKKEKGKNQQQDYFHQLEEQEVGPSIRAEKENIESVATGSAEQFQNPKKSKKKSGLFPKLFGKEKKGQSRYLSVWAEEEEEESKPLPTDSAKLPQETKKSKNKPGLFSKLLGKKKRAEKEE